MFIKLNRILVVRIWASEKENKIYLCYMLFETDVLGNGDAQNIDDNTEVRTTEICPRNCHMLNIKRICTELAKIE